MEKKIIFISHSSLDISKVRILEKLILQTKIFIPKIVADDREPFKLLEKKVIAGIRQCEYFVPIVTRQSIVTQWMNQEIGYAVALEKKIIPIVEKELIVTLKGFINKDRDLPYAFSASQTKRTEATRFERDAKKLINDLLIKNNITPKNISLEDLFPGRWQSQFTLNGKTGSDKNIEIRDGNKYFLGDKHWFNIEDLIVDVEAKKLSFTKIGVSDNRKCKNYLTIVELGKMYQGYEEPGTPITYFQERELTGYGRAEI
jgi:hypothetical protein